MRSNFARRPINAAVVLATIAALALGPGLSANAVEDPVYIPEGSLLATPDEMREAGLPEERIAAQEELFESLPTDIAEEQAELREEQAAIEPNPTTLQTFADSDVAQPPVFGGPKGGGASTNIYNQSPCASGNYKVNTSRGTFCWAATGTTGSLAGIYCANWLQPNIWVGRTLYTWDTTAYTYWTVWRGPTTQQYYYDQYYGCVHVLQVQISS